MFLAQAKYGKSASNTTEGLPPSGMRMAATTVALLDSAYDTHTGGR